jgi:hypothetical protein
VSRMLASVQKVISLSPIEGADRIEVARVLGWETIVRKGAFKVGDLGVYIEIDSIVPATPVFEFLKERKYRVRTIKLKKQVSQGLLMSFFDLDMKPFPEGKDVTDILGIQKWEPPEDAPVYQSNKKKGWWWKLVYTLPFLAMFRKKVGEGSAFPTHLVPKTDETRIQAFGPEFFEQYADVPLAVSIKMDGSSCTFIWNKGKFSVASRNVWFPNRKDNNFWKMADKSGIAQAMKKVFGKRNVCLQGELCGPGIQGNKYKFTELKFFLFGAFDSDKREYFTPGQLSYAYLDLVQLAGAKIDIVETICMGFLLADIGKDVESWIKIATSKSVFNPEAWNEGIVARSVDNKPYGVKGMEGGRFSFKAINPEFLLQYNL